VALDSSVCCRQQDPAPQLNGFAHRWLMT
jgi:hypothetical protein